MKWEKVRESDDEFEPDHANSSDDEETIAQEEKLDSGDGGKSKTEREQEEIDALKRESEISIEDLLDDLPPEYLESLRRSEPLPTHKVSINFFCVLLRILPHFCLNELGKVFENSLNHLLRATSSPQYSI